MELVIARPEGLYCPPGDFYIDPWRPVGRAVITHAHSDHARTGHGHYLAHHHSSGTLRIRLGDITLQTVEYSEPVTHNGVKISLHPAGHVLTPLDRHRGYIPVMDSSLIPAAGKALNDLLWASPGESWCGGQVISDTSIGC